MVVKVTFFLTVLLSALIAKADLFDCPASTNLICYSPNFYAYCINTHDKKVSMTTPGSTGHRDFDKPKDFTGDLPGAMAITATEKVTGQHVTTYKMNLIPSQSQPENTLYYKAEVTTEIDSKGEPPEQMPCSTPVAL